MMVSVETFLLRMKRRLEKWSLLPGVAASCRAALYGGSGLVLSGAGIWGGIQPIAAALIFGSPGIWSIAAAAGAMLGYRLFWADAGFQGMLWSAGALALVWAARFLGDSETRTLRNCALFSLLVGISGLAFQLWFADTAPPERQLLRIVIAMGGAVLFSRLDSARDSISRELTMGAGILALAQISPFPILNPGLFAAGAAAAVGSSPGAAIAGLALDLSGAVPVPMTATMCTALFFRMLPIRDSRWRIVSPGAAALAAMILLRRWDNAVLLGMTLGGAVGAMIPWRIPIVPQVGSSGPVQVRLEQMARLMNRFQRLLLEVNIAAVDEEAMAEKLRRNTCDTCSSRSGCPEQFALGVNALRDPLSFRCKKTGRVLQELRRSQEQMRLIRSAHRRQGEFRSALAQQYGFLASYFEHMADSMPHREEPAAPSFRLQVSARSRGKERSDGDRCLAFPGVGCRYYVVLCDGMGTGIGAAEEGRQAAYLLRQMLSAGLPARYALGSINAHLVLRGQAGVVTVDLAEIRLDSGKAAVYKWGAAPSWMIRRGKAKKIGTATPPPGISLSQIGEKEERLSLSRGEILVLVSDGVEVGDGQRLADRAKDATPGELATWITEQWSKNGEDDATAAVIRLRPTSLAT